MTELTHDTCVVVADGEKVLFLRNRTDAEDPNLDVTGKEEQDNPKDIAQSANRPGRGHDAGPNQRSAFDDTDWHELAKDRFAADLADELYARVHAGEIGRLVIAASPQVLGELRRHLHKEVADRVVGEIDKTLTNHPTHRIEALVREELEQSA